MTTTKKISYKTVTKIGEDRKFNRLVTHMLKDADPALYKKLAKSARDKIRRDNKSLDTPIMVKGLDVVHKTSDELYIRIQIEKARKELRDKRKAEDKLLRRNKDEKAITTSHNNRHI